MCRSLRMCASSAFVAAHVLVQVVSLRMCASKSFTVTLAAARVTVNDLNACACLLEAVWHERDKTLRVSEFWPFHLTSTGLGPNGPLARNSAPLPPPPEFRAAELFSLSLGRVI